MHNKKVIFICLIAFFIGILNISIWAIMDSAKPKKQEDMTKAINTESREISFEDLGFDGYSIGSQIKTDNNFMYDISSVEWDTDGNVAIRVSVTNTNSDATAPKFSLKYKYKDAIYKNVFMVEPASVYNIVPNKEVSYSIASTSNIPKGAELFLVADGQEYKIKP